jgi:hypothetical protein
VEWREFGAILNLLNMSEQQLRAELDAVYSSVSWRVTAPLRTLNAQLRRFVSAPVAPVIVALEEKQEFTKELTSLLAAEVQVEQMSDCTEENVTVLLSETPSEEVSLTLSAQAIFAELNTLIEKQTYAHRP